MPQGAEWKVIHMTHTEKHAAEIVRSLTEEGVLPGSQQVYRKVPSQDNYYEIMVLGSEALEAQQLLIEKNLLF